MIKAAAHSGCGLSLEIIDDYPNPSCLIFGHNVMIVTERISIR